MNHQFRTAEVAVLYDELKDVSHPEHPFIEREYSPGSNMPATDFTLPIARWLLGRRYDAVSELWGFLTPSLDTYRPVLVSALVATPPRQLDLPDYVRAELHAIYLLVMRTVTIHSRFLVQVGVRLAASTLACYPMRLTPDISPPQRAAELLRSASPMARIVVHDFLFGGWSAGRLRLNLQYDDRLYGCSAQINAAELERMQLFEAPGDDAYVSAAVTKKMLLTELNSAGLAFKTSDTRKAMLAAAREIPGMISSLVLRTDPSRRRLRREWRDGVQEWAARIHACEPMANDVLRQMGLQGLRR